MATEGVKYRSLPGTIIKHIAENGMVNESTKLIGWLRRLHSRKRFVEDFLSTRQRFKRLNVY